MKKVIVTGANGFVGTKLVRELCGSGIDVIAVVKDEKEDISALGSFKNLSVIYCALDEISSLQEKITDRDIDCFFHLAWAGSAGPARADEALQLKNALWTADALKTADKIGCGKFVCAGSIMEKETVAAVFAQGNSPSPAYIYGTGKLTAHCICKSIAGTLKTQLVWAVITNAYGEGELSPRFVNTTIRKIIKKEPLEFTSATQNYDFVHVDDVARAFRLIGEKGLANKEYVIGSSDAKPLREFITEMVSALDAGSVPVFGSVPFSGINMPIEAFDTSDTEKDSGFKASISFSDGVRRTMNFLKEVEK